MQSEGWVVEFDVVNDTDGKIKADNVTAPGGGPCTGPRRPRRKGNVSEGGDDGAQSADPLSNNGDTDKNQGENDGGRSKRKGDRKSGQGRPGHWHEALEESVIAALDSKSIRHSTGTVDVSLDKARMKLGTRGYASMAHADGILAEGTFSSTPAGVVTLAWARALSFSEGEWKTYSTDQLLATLTLTDGTYRR